MIKTQLYLMGEEFVELEQCAVSRIWVGDEHAVWQMLAQPIRIGNGDHLVTGAVHDEGRLADIPQICKSLAGIFLPLTPP